MDVDCVIFGKLYDDSGLAITHRMYVAYTVSSMVGWAGPGLHLGLRGPSGPAGSPPGDGLIVGRERAAFYQWCRVAPFTVRAMLQNHG